MKTVLSFATILAVAHALPSPNPITCGPDSNCELLNVNGTKSFRFKPGFEPGSTNHQKRFSSLHARQDAGDINLKVVMGENKMQWGCDVDILDAVTGTFDEKCGPEAGCDQSEPREFDVKKWEDDMTQPSDAKLKITMVGKYANSDVREFLRGALMTTINAPDSIEVDNEVWRTMPSASGQHWGLPSESDDCAIKRFPNYVSLNRFQGIDLIDYVEIHVELEEPKQNCLAVSILDGISGAINPLAGKFFSVAKVVCEAGMAL
ncbi:hypothetical protein F5Y19DRAFT_488993 [Xylariaceae sp. FL1651]|nr:hypothetical protein F5Y19DRAFT_488993 [Xylariaceae sp. FL1651]